MNEKAPHAFALKYCPAANLLISSSQHPSANSPRLTPLSGYPNPLFSPSACLFSSTSPILHVTLLHRTCVAFQNAGIFTPHLLFYVFYYYYFFPFSTITRSSPPGHQFQHGPHRPQGRHRLPRHRDGRRHVRTDSIRRGQPRNRPQLQRRHAHGRAPARTPQRASGGKVVPGLRNRLPQLLAACERAGPAREHARRDAALLQVGAQRARGSHPHFLGGRFGLFSRRLRPNFFQTFFDSPRQTQRDILCVGSSHTLLSSVAVLIRLSSIAPPSVSVFGEPSFWTVHMIVARRFLPPISLPYLSTVGDRSQELSSAYPYKVACTR